ncbi:MAG: hypothetical protein CENE_03072 [Candidatus Celerinatantimonas neptuna]|nr:MAG: hypothetical protein CENE_03072 [Candidatus Celerinatantimonas neptuna]
MQAIERAYQTTLLKMPHLRGLLEPTQMATVEEAITHANAFIIYYRQSPAGLFIYHFHTYAFIPGYWVDEKVILPEFRGKHLAAIAQNKLCKKLAGNSKSNLLLGCIANGNIPSIRCAQAAGRIPILEYAFLTQDDIAE